MWRLAPDLPNTTPETYRSVNGMYPTTDGAYETLPAANFQYNVCNGDTAAYRGALLLNAAGTGYAYFGSPTKLYQNTTDVTRSSGGNYTSGAWRFVSYGNLCIAVNGRSGDSPQSITMGGANFAALGGSPPKADTIAVQSLCVVLFGYNDGTDYGDGWWASDVGDATTWTPASSNDAANGRLLDTPGNITAAIAFNGGIVVFKENSCYFMRYVGKPVIWDVQLLRRDVGCISQEALLQAGNRLYWFDRRGAWSFDGANFQRIDDGVTAQTNLKAVANSRQMFGLYCEALNLCVWYLDAYSGANRTHSKTYCYNLVTGAWSVSSSYNATIGASVYVVGTLYPQNLFAAQAQGMLDTTASVDPDRWCWLVIANDGKAYNLDLPFSSATYKTGTNAGGAVVTNLVGNHAGMTSVTRVTPMLGATSTQETPQPTIYCTPTTYTDSALDDDTTKSTVTSSGSLKRFDFNHVARFMDFNISNTIGGAGTGSWKTYGFVINQGPSGTD